MTKKDIYFDNWVEQQIQDIKSLSGPILIIGGSGFIGAKMFHSLGRYRHDIYTISKNATKSWRLNNADQSKIFDIDILDSQNLKSFMERLKPKTIFNLSAYGSYSRQTDAEKIHVTNYIGTLKLIHSLLDIGCEAFVQAGSSSEYGLNCEKPTEDSELIPNSDYAVSKIGAAYLIKYYGTTLNFPCVNLRLYSIYGPFEERDRLIPNLVSHGIKGKYPSFVDKNISRDFVYIDDCIHAFVRSALTICKSAPGSSVNIATGKKTTIKSLAKLSKDIFKIKGEPIWGAMTNRKWDMKNWYGDARLAKKYIGWEAETSLKSGLEMTAKGEKMMGSRLKNVYIPVIERKISAVVTCYKDNQSIPILYERLTKVFKQNKIDYEIIFVNDASPYNDEVVIENITKNDSHVIGISHSRNFGSQSAFISGMELSTGDAIVLLDGDGQDPPELIEEFIKKWNEGYDIVYGSRVKRDAPLYMQFCYKFFYRIFKSLSDINIPVDAGDFSLIDRKAVKYLLQFPEKDIFLRGLRAWIGFKQIGVPYARPERLFGKSTNNFSKNFWWAKKGIFSFSTKPLQYIQTIGIAFFAVTVLLALYYLVYYFIHPPKNAPGITTIILLVVSIGSIQLVSISVLGDYIGKITEEVKNRPRFIRTKVMRNGRVDDIYSK